MDDSFWAWFAVAAAGALHGINPVCGWPAVAWQVHARGLPQIRRALGPMAAGHVASMSVVAGSIAAGLAIDRTWAQLVAAALLVAIGARHAVRRHGAQVGAPAGRAAWTLWSFVVSTGHGAGLMLVPALIPPCASPTAQQGFAGPVGTVIATIALHTASMLLAGAVTAALVARGWQISAGAVAKRPALPLAHPPSPRRS